MDNFRDPFQVGELDTLRAENARLAAEVARLQHEVDELNDYMKHWGEIW